MAVIPFLPVRWLNYNIMAEDKKSFIAYCDWLATFEALPDAEAGKLAKHLFLYVNDKNPITDNVLINAVFANIKQQLKRDLVKWEAKSDVRADAGRIGGIKSGESRRIKKEQKEANEANASSLKQNEHDNDNVNVNDTVKDKKEKYIFDFFSDFEKCALKENEVTLFKTICNLFIQDHKRVQQLSEPLTSYDLYRLINKYGKEETLNILDNMENYKPLLSKSVSAYKTASTWLRKDKK